MKKKVLPIKPYYYRRGRTIVRVKKHRRSYWVNPAFSNRGATPNIKRKKEKESFADVGEGGIIEPEMVKRFQAGLIKEYEPVGRKGKEPPQDFATPVSEKEAEKLKEKFEKEAEEKKGIDLKQTINREVQPGFKGTHIPPRVEVVDPGVYVPKKEETPLEMQIKAALELDAEMKAKQSADKISVQLDKETIKIPKTESEEKLFDSSRILKTIPTPTEPPEKPEEFIVVPEILQDKKEKEKIQKKVNKLLEGYTLKSVSEGEEKKPEGYIPGVRGPRGKGWQSSMDVERKLELEKHQKKLEKLLSKQEKEKEKITAPLDEFLKKYDETAIKPYKEQIQKVKKEVKRLGGRRETEEEKGYKVQKPKSDKPKTEKPPKEKKAPSKPKRQKESKPKELSFKAEELKSWVDSNVLRGLSVEQLMGQMDKEERTVFEKEVLPLYDKKSKKSPVKKNRKALKVEEYLSLLTDRVKPKRGDLYIGREGLHKLNVLPNAIPDNLMKKFHDRTYPGSEMQRLPFNKDEDIIAIKPSPVHTYTKELKDTMIDPEVLMKKVEKRKQEFGITED